MAHRWSTFGLLVALYAMYTPHFAQALPTFAVRENVSCTLCHGNGSAPHLTKIGYLYRRAGFRFPADIGNVDKDKQNMDIFRHMAIGLNVDYEITDNEASNAAAANGTPTGLTANGVNVREVEIWPAVGAFLGNYGYWTELDMSPNVNDSTHAATGGVQLSMADARYVSGTPEFFYNFRAGLIAPEGYGASDQWEDDGQLPLIDALSARNPDTGLDTLVTPLGAMNAPQMGAEFGVNAVNSGTFVTLGVYNGYDGTTKGGASVVGTSNAPEAVPTLMNPEGKLSKDYKLQVDQFFGDSFALTGVYYNGTVSLVDPSPTHTNVWQNNYQLGRLYATYFVVPSTFDVLAGAGYGDYRSISSGGTSAEGHFANRGAFIGFNWYVKQHVTISARGDYYQYAVGTNSQPIAKQATLMVSHPYENNLFVFHASTMASEIGAGNNLALTTNDFRIEWRFLY